MASYLVTGGAGFIGSHVAATLLSRGDTVRILDNFSTGHRSNLAVINGAEIIEGDVRSYHTVRDAVDGVEFVIHQAALPSVPRSIRDPITTNDVNVVGTLNVLNASRDAKVARMIYASSSSIYGRNSGLPKIEGMVPRPISPYAVSKLAGENYCQAFSDLYEFETVMLRYFNVFGPRQDPKSQYSAVIPLFIDRLVRNEPVTINGDGTQTRDFTYVDNVVAATLAACTAPNVSGKLFNIAGGEQISILDLVEALGKLLNRRIAPTFRPSRIGDIPHSYASIEAARVGIGYEPAVNFRDGLSRTVGSMSSAIAA